MKRQWNMLSLLFVGWAAIIGILFGLVVIVNLFFPWQESTPPVSGEEKITHSDYFQINKEFVPGWWSKLHGEYVQVYEFPDESQAKNFAAKIAADGNAIGEQKIPWLSPPHFFRREKIIVLYVGKRQDVLNTLSKRMGKQFAGAGF